MSGQSSRPFGHARAPCWTKQLSNRAPRRTSAANPFGGEKKSESTAVGTAVLMMLEAHQDIDITTAATASVATLNNIGPGLARVGATHNYAWFSAPSKIVMCILMVLGRLEVFTILVLFTPRFWKGE